MAHCRDWMSPAHVARVVPWAGGAVLWLPELHLLLIWAGSALGLLVWLWRIMSAVDLAVFVAVYVLCLPIIFPCTTPRLLACLGGTICGLVAGIQLIDLVFDIAILNDRQISDGSNTFQARQLAFLYYHTVVNASHVNAVLLGMILISFLGAFVGLRRCSPQLRQRWLVLGAWMFAGTGGYLVLVVPKYLVIRNAAAFDASFFDGWHWVILARLVLYASLLGSLPYMFTLQGMADDGGYEMHPLKCRPHMQ